MGITISKYIFPHRDVVEQAKAAERKNNDFQSVLDKEIDHVTRHREESEKYIDGEARSKR